MSWITNALFYSTACLSLFFVSMLMAGSFSRLRTRKVSIPREGAKIRLKQYGAVYECSFEGIERGGWKVSPPILKTNVVPLRPGERMFAEVTVENGVVIFPTNVIKRNVENGKNEFLILESPKTWRVNERRNYRRRTCNVPVQFEFTEELHGEMKDVSYGGAKIFLDKKFTPGEVLIVRFADGIVERKAWVLDSKESLNEKQCFDTRICFAEQIDEGIIKNIKAPVILIEA
jgi:c-di-GMP-binding flagellar brake protein YcgR